MTSPILPSLSTTVPLFQPWTAFSWRRRLLDGWYALRPLDPSAPAVPLTDCEYKLLWRMLDDIGRCVATEDLMTAIWGDDECIPETFDGNLRTFVRRLRAKMTQAGWGPSAIINVRQRGYGLSAEKLQYELDTYQARQRPALSMPVAGGP